MSIRTLRIQVDYVLSRYDDLCRHADELDDDQHAELTELGIVVGLITAAVDRQEDDR